jgi:hypothetical protein
VRQPRALFFLSMRWLGPLAALAAVALSALVACGNAPDTVEGGEPLFAQQASTDNDGGLLDASNPCQPGGANAGHKWSDLYACYFGPTGVVSCESQTTCHGAMGELGAMSSMYVCGPTQSNCYSGMVAGGLITPGSTADPTGSLLYIVLCRVDSNGMMAGLMPKNCPPASWLQPGDMARISAWIMEGAPND